MEWETYLEEVAKNSFTGMWVKEVAENMLSDRHESAC